MMKLLDARAVRRGTRRCAGRGRRGTRSGVRRGGEVRRAGIVAAGVATGRAGTGRSRARLGAEPPAGPADPVPGNGAAATGTGVFAGQGGPAAGRAGAGAPGPRVGPCRASRSTGAGATRRVRPPVGGAQAEGVRAADVRAAASARSCPAPGTPADGGRAAVSRESGRRASVSRAVVRGARSAVPPGVGPLGDGPGARCIDRAGLPRRARRPVRPPHDGRGPAEGCGSRAASPKRPSASGPRPRGVRRRPPASFPLGAGMGAGVRGSDHRRPTYLVATPTLRRRPLVHPARDRRRRPRDGPCLRSRTHAERSEVEMAVGVLSAVEFRRVGRRSAGADARRAAAALPRPHAHRAAAHRRETRGPGCAREGRLATSSISCAPGRPVAARRAAAWGRTGVRAVAAAGPDGAECSSGASDDGVALEACPSIPSAVVGLLPRACPDRAAPRRAHRGRRRRSAVRKRPPADLIDHGASPDEAGQVARMLHGVDGRASRRRRPGPVGARCARFPDVLDVLDGPRGRYLATRSADAGRPWHRPTPGGCATASVRCSPTRGACPADRRRAGAGRRPTGGRLTSPGRPWRMSWRPDTR